MQHNDAGTFTVRIIGDIISADYQTLSYKFLIGSIKRIKYFEKSVCLVSVLIKKFLDYLKEVCFFKLYLFHLTNLKHNNMNHL
jgi:hypothetical protein